MIAREQLASRFLELHPDAAARLLESMPVEQSAPVLSCADPQCAAPVIERMLPVHAARCIADMEPSMAVARLGLLPTRASVAILRQLPEPARDRALAALGTRWSAAFRLLIAYPVNTVGAWMEPRVFTLPYDCSVSEARARIERDGHAGQTRVFVVDRGQRIQGAVRSLSLLQDGQDLKLTAILEPADALWAREPLLLAQESPIWERETEAPVVNRERAFVGAITYVALRKAHHPRNTAASAADRRALSEVTELMAAGAGSVWESIGELIDHGRSQWPPRTK